MKRIVPIVSIGMIVLVLGAGIIYGASHFLPKFSFNFSTASLARAAFPTINDAGLSATQVKILQLARSEYAKNPQSYDDNVMIYSQGNREAWCADFISWVMLQAGVPYSNPNNGGWRIPGVLTLQEYYQSKGRYYPVGSYSPQLGDVAIYNSKQTRDPSNNEHAAIVLAINGDQLTTIGGNEGGKMVIDTRALRLGEDGLVGFGKLKEPI